MHILVNVSPNFFRFAPLILKRISVTEPHLSISAVVSGGEHIFTEFVQRINGIPTNQVLNLSLLEIEWLGRPYIPGRLREYENILGDNAVNRLIQADRLVGWEYVRGGVLPKTPLADICESDENRHKYICGLLDTLFDWFEKRRPDVVFTYAIAGCVTLGLALVAKHFGVAYRCLNQIRLGDRCILDSSITNMATPIRNLYLQACEDEDVVSGERKEARRHLNQMRERLEQPDYYLTVRKNVLKLPPAKDMAALVWRAISRRPPDSSAAPYQMTRFWWEIFRFIKAHYIISREKYDTPSIGNDFVFYPLHVDPEASTMVLAPYAVNQLAVLEALAKSIPAEWTIIVKDHYPMLGRRPANFYKILRKIPKVRIVSPVVSTFELIQASRMVTVITGTAGWESMQLGRPTLCLGPAHYQNIGEGFVLESDFSKLPEAVERTLATPPASEKALELYIAAMLKASFSLPGRILNDMSISNDYLGTQELSINAIADQLSQTYHQLKTARLT